MKAGSHASRLPGQAALQHTPQLSSVARRRASHVLRWFSTSRVPRYLPEAEDLPRPCSSSPAAVLPVLIPTGSCRLPPPSASPGLACGQAERRGQAFAGARALGAKAATARTNDASPGSCLAAGPCATAWRLPPPSPPLMTGCCVCGCVLHGGVHGVQACSKRYIRCVEREGGGVQGANVRPRGRRHGKECGSRGEGAPSVERTMMRGVGRLLRAGQVLAAGVAREGAMQLWGCERVQRCSSSEPGGCNAGSTRLFNRGVRGSSFESEMGEASGRGESSRQAQPRAQPGSGAGLAARSPPAWQ